ncbi:hypothetical protein KXX41_006303, partial [Aspergillus fumigatus]
LSWREDMGKCRGMECRVVGNKKVYIKEVRPQDEVDDVGSSEDSSGSGSESESVMDWNGVMKRNVVVSSAGLIDGTRDMMEIQERYKDIGRAVKRLRGCRSVREQAEYWDDLLEQLEVNYGLVDRMIRRLKGFYDDG